MVSITVLTCPNNNYLESDIARTLGPRRFEESSKFICS